MQDLNITLIQTPLYWQNAGANLAMLEEKLWQIEEETDLIILPEMFSSGFTMTPEQVAEPMNFTSFKWMKQMAAQKKATIVGSLVIKDQGNYYNRLIWMSSNGEYSTYDKRHLFRMANEHEHYASGKEKLLRDIKGWRVCPLICYDLRFPVWSRNTGDNVYDLLIYVANWPAPRVSAWDILLKGRAVENLCYAIGVNRIGIDGNEVEYVGHSQVIDPKGDVILNCEEKEVIKTLSLSHKELIDYRKKFPAHLDADDFTLL